MTTNVQVSSYGDLKGVMQVTRDDVARQLIGLLNAVNRKLGYTTATTPRVTPNEVFRGKARQQALLNARILYVSGRGPFAALAASPLYSSNHGPDGDIEKSIAVDIGITEVDGSNRALNVGEQAAWRALENDWGFVSAGDAFSSPEPWHKEYRLPPKNIEPVGIRIAADAKPEPFTAYKEPDMLLRQATGAQAGTNGDIKNFVFLIDPLNKTIRRISNLNELAELKKDLVLRSTSQAIIWDLARTDTNNYKRIGF